MPAPVDGTVVVRCFHGKGAGGNWHRVILPSASGWNPQRAVLLSLKIAPTTVVLVEKHEQCISGGRFFSLAYFRNGIAITRCGSGSLAAAKALISVDSCLRLPLNFATAGGLVQVVSNDSGLLGYKIKALPYFYDNDLRRWQAIIDRKLRSMVLIGNDHDYCLLELSDPSALKQCCVNARRLSLMSRRAVIVTAKSCTARHDYALRYFSPQYGKYEDDATGSAHAMAAAYWQDRFARPWIRGVQQSAAGGEFRVQRLGLQQCVYGRAD